MRTLNKILKSSLLLLIGSLVGRTSMFVTNILVARLLSQPEFGQYSLIRSSIIMFANSLNGSLGATTIKYVSSYKNSRKVDDYLLSVFYVNIFIVIIAICGIVIFRNQVESKFLLDGDRLFYIGIISIILLVVTLTSNFLQFILIGKENYQSIAKISFITSCVSMPVIFTLVYIYRLEGSLLAVCFYFSIDTIFKYVQTKKTVRIKFKIKKLKAILSSIIKVLKLNHHLIISVMISSILFWYARVTLLTYTNDFVDIAIFDAAYQWLTIIMIITGATTNVALPMLSKSKFSSLDERKKIFWTNFSVNLFISVAISLIFYINAEHIMRLYGEDYIVGKHTVRVLCLVAVFFTMSSVLNKYLISQEKNSLILSGTIVGSLNFYITLVMNINDKSVGLSWAFVSYYCSLFIIYAINIIKLNRDN